MDNDILMGLALWAVISALAVIKGYQLQHAVLGGLVVAGVLLTLIVALLPMPEPRVTPTSIASPEIEIVAPEPEPTSLAAEEVPPAPAAEQAQEPGSFRIIDNQIVTDKFDVRYDLRDRELTVALDTDLGDAAGLMVSVSRSYWEQGSNEAYPVNYFSARSTVGEWRHPRRITLDHDAWEREIGQRQRALAAAGEPFTVSRIANSIAISLVVPVNQGPPFERFNANLRGDVVTQSGNLRVVRQVVTVPYPVDATGVGQTRFADPLNLARGVTYRGSREIPLVPEIDPPDPLAAIASIRQLSAGEEFTVLGVTVHRNTPWYRAQTHLGDGWINSTALLGQEVVVVR